MTFLLGLLYYSTCASYNTGLSKLCLEDCLNLKAWLDSLPKDSYFTIDHILESKNPKTL